MDEGPGETHQVIPLWEIAFFAFHQGRLASRQRDQVCLDLHVKDLIDCQLSIIACCWRKSEIRPERVGLYHLSVGGKMEQVVLG